MLSVGRHRHADEEDNRYDEEGLAIEGEEPPAPDARDNAHEEEGQKRQRRLDQEGDREVVPPTDVAVAAGEEGRASLYETLTVQEPLTESIRQETMRVDPPDERGNRRHRALGGRVMLERE